MDIYRATIAVEAILTGNKYQMPVFKTTDEILNSPWKEGQVMPDLPIRHEWVKSRKIEFSDVTIWEQIYFQPGNIGIYAAWSPYVEMYAITYNLLGHYEIYSGESAGNQVYQRAHLLGISLPVNTVWVPPSDPLLSTRQLTPF